MIWVVHPRSGSWFVTHPGSRIQGSKRHRIRIRKTVDKLVISFPDILWSRASCRSWRRVREWHCPRCCTRKRWSAGEGSCYGPHSPDSSLGWTKPMFTNRSPAICTEHPEQDPWIKIQCNFTEPSLLNFVWFFKPHLYARNNWQRNTLP